ncbi:hypothetical protein [Chthoniobacter flavus]|nr:hypothetical protein [Chthoniobacter flavus]
MHRFAITLVLLLMFCAYSRTTNSRYGKWIPVDGISVTSEPDGETLLTSTDLVQAMIFADDHQGNSTIWFQLTDAAKGRYRPPADGKQWTLRLRGAALASVTDQSTMGSFQNNYLFRVADVPLPSGKRISEVILIHQNDAL